MNWKGRWGQTFSPQQSLMPIPEDERRTRGEIHPGQAEQVDAGQGRGAVCVSEPTVLRVVAQWRVTHTTWVHI